jgi:predicted GNAT family acetyltransferase
MKRARELGDSSPSVVVQHDEKSKTFFLCPDGKPVKSRRCILEYETSIISIARDILGTTEQVEQKVMAITHTFTPSQLRGRGYAGQLCAAAYEFAEANGWEVEPVCSFVRDKWLSSRAKVNQENPK